MIGDTVNLGALCHGCHHNGKRANTKLRPAYWSRKEEKKMRAKNLTALLAVLALAGMAFGYTAVTRPVYIDYTLCGGQSNYLAGASNVYDVNGGFAVSYDSVHMAAGVQKDTLSLTKGYVYDPLIYSLDGSVTLYIGIPAYPGSTTINYYETPGDSYGLVVPGKFDKFYIAKSGTVDSTTATGYQIIGRTAPSVQRMKF